MNAAELLKSVFSMLDKSHVRDLEDVTKAAKRQNHENVRDFMFSFVVSHVFVPA